MRSNGKFLISTGVLAAVAAACIISFQDCTSSGGKISTATIGNVGSAPGAVVNTTSGTGTNVSSSPLPSAGNNDGEVFAGDYYQHPLSGTVCADGKMFDAAINRDSVHYYLVRNNCQDLATGIALAPAQMTVTPNGATLNYNNVPFPKTAVPLPQNFCPVFPFPFYSQSGSCTAQLNAMQAGLLTFNPGLGFGAALVYGGNFCGTATTALTNAISGNSIAVTSSGAGAITGNVAAVLSYGPIPSIQVTDLIAQLTTVGSISGNDMEVTAQSIDSISGTNILVQAGSIGGVETGTAGNNICSFADRITEVSTGTGSYNTATFSPSTPGTTGTIATLDIRRSNTTTLNNIHVTTLIECPSEYHINGGRLILNNSTYDNLSLVADPNCQ